MSNPTRSPARVSLFSFVPLPWINSCGAQQCTPMLTLCGPIRQLSVKELDPTIPCRNDRDWRVQVGGALKSCFWVGKFPSNRCDRSIGTDGVPAAVACPQQCDPDCESVRS